MDNRDKSILTQVAFKGAIEVCGENIGSDAGNLAFIETLTFLTDCLMAEVADRTGVTTNVLSTPAPTPAPAPAPQAQAAVQEVFGQVEQVNTNVEIIPTKDGAPFGDMPAWLISAAQAKGVTKVFDNRNRLSSNPKLPWFKAPKDQGEHAFWPPKGVSA
jgi:hypothetical protein